MIKYILIPFTSWFITLFYAGVMGKDNLIKYAIGQEKVLIEEYYIIVVIVTIITVISHIIQYRKHSK